MIFLNPKALKDLEKAVLKAQPNEASGFLLGLKSESRYLVFSIIEGASQNLNQYLLTAKELDAAEEAAKKESLSVLGFYHSHPNGRPNPSETDHEEALPGYVYAICSLTANQMGDINFYVLDENSGFLRPINPITNDEAEPLSPNPLLNPPLEKDNHLTPELSLKELTRYRSHLSLPLVGLEGQKRLKAARVLVVGAGGLGSPISYYLAAAGVGTLGLVDDDQVELGNLQRQILFAENDLGQPKTLAAKNRLLALNPHINLLTFETRLNRHNAMEILKDWDLIVDATDNFPTRYLINDAAAFLGLPMVYGSIHQFEGQASFFWAKNGPCYRCLYPTPPRPTSVPSCGETGVMGALPGLIGSIQAIEAIKHILGGAQTLLGRLLFLDAWLMEFTEMPLDKDPNCPICGPKPTITELIDYEVFCDLNPKELKAPGLTAQEFKEKLAQGEPLQIIDLREAQEREIWPIPQALPIAYVDLSQRYVELNPQIETVVVCEIGQKSLFAIRALKKAGYQGSLFNLINGARALTQINEN